MMISRRSSESLRRRARIAISPRLTWPIACANAVRSARAIRRNRCTESAMPKIDFANLIEDRRAEREAASVLLQSDDLAALMRAAAARRDAAHGNVVSYSRKVFIPLTRLCRDICHYCTFAAAPRNQTSAYLSLDEVLAIARAGAVAGCKEALFTLGDKPELRYRTAREALQ